MKPRLWADIALAGLMLLLYVLWPLGTVLGISPAIMVLTGGVVAGIFLVADHACNTAQSEGRGCTEATPEKSPRRQVDAAAWTSP